MKSEIYNVGDYVYHTDHIFQITSVKLNGYILKLIVGNKGPIFEGYETVHTYYDYVGTDLERAKKEVIKWILKNQ